MKGISAIILAAGQGRRMKSSLPKVAHLVLGKPVVWHVAQAARAAGIREMVFVLGYGRDKVLPVVEAFGGKVAIQESQFGTGDAARCGLAELSAGAKEVVVLCGDAPLIRPATIRALLAARRRQGAPASVLTGVLDDPTGYGRIVRDAKGRVVRIVEHKDATPAQRSIREINCGIYCAEPMKERKELEMKLLVGSRRTIVGNADQLRFNNLSGRYWTYANLWTRTVRDLEEGRTHRDTGGNIRRTSVDQRESVDREHIDRVAEALLEARRACGLAGDPSDIPSIRETLYARALEISASGGGKKVEFVVSVEGGKPKVKAVLS